MQLGNSVIVGSVKGHLGALSGLWWKWKYLQIITAEKLSEKLLCDVCIPLREFYLFSHKAVFEHCSCETEKVVFWSTLKTMAKSELSSSKTQKEAFQETALWYVHSLHRIKVYSTLPSVQILSLRNMWKDIKWRPGGLWWARKCLPMKTGEKISKQLFCDVCIHLIELNHSLDWAVWNHCFCGTSGRTFGIVLWNMEK